MLVSPGTEITVIDESQYLPTAVGTVPFVLLATAQDKVFNGVIAPYTTKNNAGKLLAITSQRDLITNFGYPAFQESASGTPLHGHELNEYGLMAAYTAMGTSNRMFIIRADIDLEQLTGTSIRPIGAPADGTYWLDLTNTSWGIYEWNAVLQEYIERLPMVITSPTATTTIGGIPTPNANVGQLGSYAVIASSSRNHVFYKRRDNIWALVGSNEWQKAWPTIRGAITSPTILAGAQLVINTVTVTFIGTTLALAASSINSAAIAGVTADIVNNALVLYVTSAAKSNGSMVDGLININDGTLSPAAALGVATGVTASPSLEYGGYIQIPDWRATDATPRPTGSIWAKTSSLGSGVNMSLKQFDMENGVWTPLAAPVYNNEADAIYAFDEFAGGFGIQGGTIYIQSDPLVSGKLGYRPMYRSTQGATIATGTTPVTPMAFTVGDSFILSVTNTFTAGVTPHTITITGTTRDEFITAVLATAIPEVTAEIDATGAIIIIHKQGGTMWFTPQVGTPLAMAGFTSATAGLQVEGFVLKMSNFTPLTYTYALTQPYTAPEDGTLWYYNNPLDVDIMINETTGWKGYRNVTRDARGFNLVNTDANGIIYAPLAPVTNTQNFPLVPGDLWLNTGDLENYPAISRRSNNGKWVRIDNTDVVTQNGIVFADARWDKNGTADPSTDQYPSTEGLLMSNYTDLDCPDHRLYPRGTLLFNTRRSGFNVKHYVSNYFSIQSYPDDALPQQKATWVSSSGLMNSGAPYMGHKAQRQMVTKAMKAALDVSDAVREEVFAFNLLVTPGYPELIPNMIQLNNDRKCTGFIIGDTPMTMPANIMAITQWSTGASDDGLRNADPYLGVYYPSGLSNDLEGNTIVVPASHMILRAAIKSDQVSYPWFAYAGTRRGLIDNASDIGYVNSRTGAFVRNGLNQGLRDALYMLNINPITLLPNIGLVNFGNKTRQGTASAMDRINVARLVNYIRTILAHAGDAFLFEPNDAITRSQFKNMIDSALNDLIAKRGVYDYLVICDESNNTNDRIARNEIYCDIAIEPMKAVEFIYIPIRLKNPGGIAASGK